MHDKMLKALLVLSDGHFNEATADMAINMMVPNTMHYAGEPFKGTLREYLEKMNIHYSTARKMIEDKAGKLPESVTCGDAYYAMAMVMADYGLAIHGDASMAAKLAYGWLTDPDR